MLSLYVALGQVDSALAFGKLALASGADKDAIGGALLTLIGPAMNLAQQKDTVRADWGGLPRDRCGGLVGSAGSDRVLHVTRGLQDGGEWFPRVQELEKTDKPKACSELKYAADMITVVDLNMARGGRFNPQAAANILTAVSAQVKPYIEAKKEPLGY